MLTNHAQLDAKWELKIEQNEDHTCIYYEFGITTKKLHDQWFRKMGFGNENYWSSCIHKLELKSRKVPSHIYAYTPMGTEIRHKHDHICVYKD